MYLQVAKKILISKFSSGAKYNTKALYIYNSKGAYAIKTNGRLP